MLYNFVVISMLTFIMNTESILFHRCWYEENSLQWIMYGPIVVSICVSKYLFYPIVVSSFRIGDLYIYILFRTIPLQRGAYHQGRSSGHRCIYCSFARYSGEREKTSWLGIRIVCGATCRFPVLIQLTNVHDVFNNNHLLTEATLVLIPLKRHFKDTIFICRNKSYKKAFSELSYTLDIIHSDSSFTAKL